MLCKTATQRPALPAAGENQLMKRKTAIVQNQTQKTRQNPQRPVHHSTAFRSFLSQKRGHTCTHHNPLYTQLRQACKFCTKAVQRMGISRHQRGPEVHRGCGLLDLWIGGGQHLCYPTPMRKLIPLPRPGLPFNDRSLT